MTGIGTTRLTTILLLCLAALAVAGVALIRSADQRSNSPVTVGIGIDLPLIYGAAIDPSDNDTAQLFLEEHPGTRIRIQPVFNHPLPERAAPDLQAAIDSGIRFMVLTQASSHAVPSRHLFDDGAALGIHVAATSLELSGRDDDILRIIPDLEAEQTAIARQVAASDGQRLLVIQDTGNPAYTGPALGVFSQRLLEQGPWQITTVPIRVTEFDPGQVEAVMREEFDALYILGGAFLAPIGNIAQLFHRHHPQAPIFLTPWARSPSVLEHSGAAVDRLQMLSMYPSRASDPAIDAFYRRFQERFGYNPQSMSIGTWQALELFHAAFEQGHDTPESARHFLLSKPQHTTSLGRIEFDRHGDVPGQFHPIEDLREALQ